MSLLIHEWPVVLSAATLLLGTALGFVLAHLARNRDAYKRGYRAGWQARSAKAITDAINLRPPRPRTTPAMARTQLLPAVADQTAVLPRRHP